MKVYIVGMPGAGKTQLGRRLSRVLNVPFIDIDTEIENKEKMSIRKFIEEKGEDQFRKKEREVLNQTSEIKHAIVSCGGGTPCFYDNMEWINRHGKSIWLDVPVEVLANRIFKNQSRRPMFSGLSFVELTEELTKLLERRKKFFTKSKIVFKEKREKGVLLTSVIQSLTKSN